MDCMEYMGQFPDKFFDLACVDPPYGIGEGQKKVNSRAIIKTKWKSARPPKYGGSEWDTSTPTNEYFVELKRVSKNQIIWGANHFGFMHPSSAWLVWYKKRFDEINDFSDAELAYTSFKTGCRLFHFPWIGFGAVNAGEKRIHPTQKPVQLYRWIFKNYTKPGFKILDTHLGSGSSRIAAHDMKCDFWSCEIDTEYYLTAERRYTEYMSQLSII